jgi:hypothetical protein
MTNTELKMLQINNRIHLLSSRGKENRRVVQKLERQLRNLKNSNIE